MSVKAKSVYAHKLASLAVLGLSFKPINAQDFVFLKDVYRSTREEELEQTGWDEEQKTEFVGMQFEAQHSHYQRHYPDADWLIIKRKKKKIGRLYIEEWPSELRIIDIALLPAVRGNGLGKAILENLMSTAAERDKTVGIHVEKNNSAMGLYQKLGFTKTEDKGVYDLLHWRRET